MVHTYCLHDRAEIEPYLRRHPLLHLYEIGDLDDFFWPHTLWYADGRGDAMSALCLVYAGQSQPTLLALGDPVPLTALLRQIANLLPDWFYAHVSPGVETAFAESFHLEPHGDHLKMSLRELPPARPASRQLVERLGPEHLQEVLTLYEESYPGNWFDPRTLETREYFGIRDAGRLASIAGVHVFSPKYRVAALGNITTHPGHRNKGLAFIVTTELCRSLREKTDHIGLNVGADNQTAIGCYRKIGFDVVARYREFLVHKIR